MELLTTSKVASDNSVDILSKRKRNRYVESRCSQRDIAEAIGVSVSDVSKVLRHDDSGITCNSIQSDILDKVYQASQDLNYHVNRVTYGHISKLARVSLYHTFSILTTAEDLKKYPELSTHYPEQVEYICVPYKHIYHSTEPTRVTDAAKKLGWTGYQGTAKDIAARTNISYQLCLQVLKRLYTSPDTQKSLKINDDMRNRILETADSLGYDIKTPYYARRIYQLKNAETLSKMQFNPKLRVQGKVSDDDAYKMIGEWVDVDKRVIADIIAAYMLLTN
jgi:transcriptional regulator with XRE-family HTH domain